jgi:formate hydrogenlyase subunit 3/multisubunit Na+/H+ antiporter MnhD subunit
MNFPADVIEALTRLRDDLVALVRAEMHNFRNEAIEQLRPLALASAMVGAALVAGIAFFGAFSAFFILVLSLAMAPWLAALVVTVVYGLVAGGLAAAAIAKVRATLPIDFKRTAHSVKEDVAWIKSELTSGK